MGRFADEVKQIMQSAREESVRVGHFYIGTGILLGILRGGGEAVELLQRLQPGLKRMNRLRQVVEGASAGQRSGARDAAEAADRAGLPFSPPFTPRARQILEGAAIEAEGVDSGEIRSVTCSWPYSATLKPPLPRQWLRLISTTRWFKGEVEGSES